VFLRGQDWHFQFRWNRKSYSGNTHAASKAEAERVLAEAIVNVTGRCAADPSSASWVTFAECAEKAEVRAQSRVKRFVEFLGDNDYVADINRFRVQQYADIRSQEVVATTVHRELGDISKAFSWAVSHGLIDDNPARGVKRPRAVANPRPALTREERDAVLELLRGHVTLEAAFMLAFFAGMRETEATRAKWEHVNFEAKQIFVDGTKTRLARAHLPLHKRLLEFLSSRETKEGHIVLSSRRKPLTLSGLSNCRLRWNRNHGDDEQLPGFGVGRSTLGTVLARSGVPMEKIQKLLRHRHIATTISHYAHLRPSDAAAELDEFLSFRATALASM